MTRARSNGTIPAIGVMTGVLAAIAGPAGQVDGGECMPVWDGTLGGMSGGYVASLLEHDDGAGGGPQLYATGTFTSADGNPDTARIARWDGASWTGVGGGLQSQFSNVLGSFAGDLYVGGYFNSAGNVPGTAKLARWDGAAWQSVGAELESFLSSVWALQVFDDGSGEALYIGGNYLDIGGTGIDHIARWDGRTYTEVGGTIVGPNQIVLDLAVFQGELYACGRFQTIAGVPATNIARWDGVTWKPVGGGLGGVQVIDLEVVGDHLYAGGSFTSAGGEPATRVARWDGATWEPLGPGLNATVQDLAWYDDGSGGAIYAVGSFTGTGDDSVAFEKIARWDGATWSAVGSGADANVFESYIWDPGAGPVLLVGGSFSSVDGVSSNSVAAYVGCAGPECPPCPDFTGDGLVDGADLGVLLAAWGTGEICVDLNGDGVVDGADLGLLLGAWGPCST